MITSTYNDRSFFSKSAQVERSPIAIPVGYCNPISTNIFSVSEVKIIEGESKLCVAPIIYSPSEMYLAFRSHFPSKVDDFCRKMTKFYQSLSNQPQFYELIVDDRLLQPGAVVVFRRNLKIDPSPKEWVRAKVVKRTDSREEGEYMVQLIDFGEYYSVSKASLLYLHESFAHQLGFAIRCRFKFSNEKYRGYHARYKKWSRDARDKFFEVMKDETLLIQFLNTAVDEGEQIWEVALLKFHLPMSNTLFDKKSGIPYQEQLVDRIFTVAGGKYPALESSSDETDSEEDEDCSRRVVRRRTRHV